MLHHKKARRAFWAEIGNYIYYSEEKNIAIGSWKYQTPSHQPTEAEEKRGYIQINGHIDMVMYGNTDDCFRLIGWTPSRADVDADDWEIID